MQLGWKDYTSADALLLSQLIRNIDQVVVDGHYTKLIIVLDLTNSVLQMSIRASVNKNDPC